MGAINAKILAEAIKAAMDEDTKGLCQHPNLQDQEGDPVFENGAFVEDKTKLWVDGVIDLVKAAEKLNAARRG